jgi:hypothetical protein
MWHDQDHKPEVVGTVPNIFISQRWVAPAELMAVRPPSSLEHNGGEYVNLYWSTGTPGELDADFDVLGRRLELVGRMQPMQYIHRTWGRRLRPISAYTRAGLELSAEAVTCAPQNTGLRPVSGYRRLLADYGQGVPGRRRCSHAHPFRNVPSEHWTLRVL